MKFLIVALFGSLFLVPVESRASGGDFDLERMQTVHGRTYHEILILGADTHGLTFRHREGIAKIEFQSLSENIRLLYEVMDEIPDSAPEENGQSAPVAAASETGESGKDDLVLTVYHRLTLYSPAGCDPRQGAIHWPASWSRYHPAHQLTIPCYRGSTVRDFLFLSGLSRGAFRDPYPGYSVPGLRFPFPGIF